MPKTSLPEKIKAPTLTTTGSSIVTVCPLNQEALVINQLIDYLKESEDIVEEAYGRGVNDGALSERLDAALPDNHPAKRWPIPVDMTHAVHRGSSFMTSGTPGTLEKPDEKPKQPNEIFITESIPGCWHVECGHFGSRVEAEAYRERLLEMGKE